MRVLVLGANGLIGSTVTRVMSESEHYDVWGTVRRDSTKELFSSDIGKKIVGGVDVENQDSLIDVFNEIKPEVVVNCAGLTKHKPQAENPLASIPINTLMPHRLAKMCALSGSRLIHISTDCVFSGEKGMYAENDFTDARDFYGKSKALGEVDYFNAITLRTSTIGHELNTNYGLLDWFLSQSDSCKGYSRAIFSGLPTVVLAQVIRDIVIPRDELTGLYHVGAQPINKYDLLKLIAEVYGKAIKVVSDDKLVIDRSLNSDKFRLATGYVSPSWPELIRIMHAYQ